MGSTRRAFTTMRQLGGAFGVAILGAAFAATGSYATPSTFSQGFVTAFGAAAGLALAGAVAGTILPTLRRRPSPAASAEPGTPSGAAGRPPPRRSHLAGLDHRP